MTDFSNIFDLPTDPVNNISLNMKEEGAQQTQTQTQLTQQQMSLDPTTISQIVNGLQQASIAGATQLSSRDIQQESSIHNIDEHVQPNFVPKPPQEQRNYIQEDEYELNSNYKVNNRYEVSTLDQMYDEIQTPLLLAVLYFLFQLPIVKKFLFQYLPFLFLTDGNMNFSGFVFISALFGMIFYIINIGLVQFNKF
jgi:hypothetical protein